MSTNFVANVYCTQSYGAYVQGQTYTLPQATYQPLINIGVMQLAGQPYQLPFGASQPLGTSTVPFTWNGSQTTTVTGASAAVQGMAQPTTFTLTANTGVTNAVVRIEASLDGVNFTGIATLQLSAPGTAQVPVALPYPYVRANVIAIAGGSVSVSASSGTTPLTVTGAAVNPSLTGIPAPSWTMLASSGIPMVYPTSGTVGANGALSGIVALTGIYQCWMYFPAGAVYSGSVAGMYYVAMSSTTAGTIYNNILTNGIPYIPGVGNNPALVPIVAAGPGAYTQTTSFPFINMLSITIPGGSLGLNGQIKITYQGRCANNANAKGLLAYFNGANGQEISNATAASQNLFGIQRHIRCCGVNNLQMAWDHTSTNIYYDLGVNGSSTGTDFTLDVTSNQVLTICPQITTASTDWVMLTGFNIEILSQQ